MLNFTNSPLHSRELYWPVWTIFYGEAAVKACVEVYYLILLEKYRW
jgi:hypothetical protein